MIPTLTRFQLTPAGDFYKLQLMTEDGNTIEILATFDQLDLLSEEIDRQLDADSDEIADVG